jgi:lipid A ethanolaminephosphotransferase
MKLKPQRAELLIVLTALLLTVFYNVPLWRKIFTIVQPDSLKTALFVVALFVFIVAFFSLVFSLFGYKYIVRPLLTIILPVSSLAAYFMNQYGISIDSKMIQNVLETNFSESLDLLTVKLVIYFLVLGLLPVYLLWKIPVKKVSGMAFIKTRLLSIVAIIVVLALVVGAFYQGFAPLFRNNRELKYYIVPNNFMTGLYNNFKSASPKGPIKVIGADAAKGESWAHATRKKLVVLVVGETARAANFGLDGYARNTTPELAATPGVVNFTNVHSCGTSTAVSVPCIFSGMGRKDYDAKQAEQQEGLLDIVKRAGVSVLWIDNQSGCYRTCTRVTFMPISAAKVPEFCSDKECHDEILVKKLNEYVAGMQNDTLVVLHQMGSHGPAYYARYPVPDFEKFTPVCKTSQMDQCQQQQIINAYDNTILYTDKVLADAISSLSTYSEKYDTALIYMSDHGESLGEYNLYLHGAPYAFAPEYQTHIPAIAWLSEGIKKDAGIRPDCLSKKKDDVLSHDNIFHSVLGLLDIRTNLYDKQLDIFSSCHS